MKTHYSPKTKKIERCSGNCLYGDYTPHFRTMREGNSWLKIKLSKENDAVPESMSKRGRRGNAPVPHPLSKRPTEPTTLAFTTPEGGSYRFATQHDYTAPHGVIYECQDKWNDCAGAISLKSPLFVSIEDEGGNWVKKLKSHYNTTGVGITDAIRADGYDSLVIVDNKDPQKSYFFIDMRDGEGLANSKGSNLGNYLDNVPDKMFKHGESRYDDVMKIDIHDIVGTLVDNSAYAAKSFSGKPDWSKIDNTWSDRLEFPSPGKNEAFVSERSAMNNGGLIEEQYVASKSELSEMSNRQLATISGYISDDFDLNGALLHGKVDEGYASRIRDVDAALQKAPKENRIVYRGTYSSFLNSSGKVEIGDELKFDSYQSSSLSFDVALEFSMDTPADGVILEISTPEGLSIQSVSSYDFEREVLLPRGARYVVVGQYEATYVHANPLLPGGSKRVLQLIAVNDDGEILDGSNYQTPPIPTTRSELLK